MSPEDITSIGPRADFAFLLTVSAGQTVSLEFDYSGAFASPGGAYRLSWEKQLNAQTWPISVTVQPPGRPSRRWTSDLSVDRHFAA